MRQRAILGVVIGALSMAGVAVAREGREGGGPRGEMPPAVKAIKDKYQAQKEQLHNDCKQKMQTLEEAERNEMRAAMQAEHEQRMKGMEEKYQQHLQEMDKHWDEHMQEKQRRHEEHSQ